MDVTVFGATGAIGRLVVSDLLEAGHTVLAYARNPDKVPPEWGEGVEVVIGKITDPHAIDSAVSHADAVISALGPSMDPRTHGQPLIQGTYHIIRSMRRHNVSRFIGHATPSIVDRRDRTTVQMRLIGLMARTLLPRAYRELSSMSAHIMSSDRDWTIVRFIAPTDGVSKGIAHQGFFGTDRIGWKTTRADIAAFTVAQLTDSRYSRAAPAISN